MTTVETLPLHTLVIISDGEHSLEFERINELDWLLNETGRVEYEEGTYCFEEVDDIMVELVGKGYEVETIIDGWAGDDDPMDGDWDSGMASAGWGTDEDYGYYPDDFDMF